MEQSLNIFLSLYHRCGPSIYDLGTHVVCVMLRVCVWLDCVHVRQRELHLTGHAAVIAC